MKVRMLLLSVGMLAALLMSSCASTTPMTTARDNGWSHYGDAQRTQGEVIALGAISGGESDVIIEGEIVEVCPQMGCWLWVTDGEKKIFVKFKDHKFFVPMDVAGRRIVMHGTSDKQMMSVEEQRHYLEDAEAPAEEIAKITKPAERITFLADAVYIDGEWPATQPEK